MGLAEHTGQLADELSGGQQQRVAVARALASQPTVLLADEPTAEQDSKSRELVLDRMLAISADGGTLVLATHDPEVAQRCDRVLDLSQLRTGPVSDPGFAPRYHWRGPRHLGLPELYLFGSSLEPPRIVRSRQPQQRRWAQVLTCPPSASAPATRRRSYMLRRWCIPLAGLGLVLGIAGGGRPGRRGARRAPHAAHLIRPAAHLVRPTGHGTRPLVAHGGPANAASSTNWSGYAAASGTYKSVSASWTEPTGTCSGSAKYSSFWVGLDGYNSSTVEQTGSEVDCCGRTAAVLLVVRDVPGVPGELQQHGAARGPVHRVGDVQRRQQLHAGAE